MNNKVKPASYMVALCKTPGHLTPHSAVLLYRLHFTGCMSLDTFSPNAYKSILKILSANMGPAVQVKPTTQTTVKLF